MNDIIQEGRRLLAEALDIQGTDEWMALMVYAEDHLAALLDLAEAAGRADILLPENAECGGPEQNRDVHERVAALRAAITRLQDSP